MFHLIYSTRGFSGVCIV